MSVPTPIADGRELAALVATLRDEPVYALDTEFHRERSYYPRLALLQLAWRDGIALVDPLLVDVAPLSEILDGPGLCLIHAAQQDLEVLSRACGTIPARLFDTQLAACFLGYATPALTNLLSAVLGVRLPKGDRLTDWLKRPLTDDQLTYAAADVAHLLELYATLRDLLVARGRLDWALDECELLRTRRVGPGEPELAWLKIKDHRHLKGPARGVAQSVAAWRECKAAELDIPARFVLADLAVLGIAQRPPATVDELRRVRGIEDRHGKGRLAEEILAAVTAGKALPSSAIREPDTDDVARELRPAVTLVSAWISQLARDLDLDTGVLATRSDIVDLLNRNQGARLATGWRAALVGERVTELVEGRAGLAFDGRGNLRLVPVEPVGVEPVGVEPIGVEPDEGQGSLGQSAVHN